MPAIKFFSTNGHPERIDFRDALLAGQASDKGLYMPESIPQIPLSKVLSFSLMSYPEIAYEVIHPYVSGLIPEDAFRSMLAKAYDFEVPVEKVYEGKYLLRLDRGPTCSFKDFAAR